MKKATAVNTFICFVFSGLAFPRDDLGATIAKICCSSHRDTETQTEIEILHTAVAGIAVFDLPANAYTYFYTHIYVYMYIYVYTYCMYNTYMKTLPCKTHGAYKSL